MQHLAIEKALFGTVLILVISLPLSESLKTVAFLIGLILLGAHWFQSGRLEVTPIGWAALGYLVVLFVSAAASDHFTLALRGVWDFFMACGTYLLVINVCTTEKRTFGLIWALVPPVLVAEASGFYHYFNGGQRLWLLSFGEGNTSAQALMMVLSLWIGIFLVGGVGRARWLLGGMLIPSLAALLLTGTRGVWIALLVLLGVLMGLERSRWVTIVGGIVLVSGLVGLSAGGALPDRIHSVFMPSRLLDAAGRLNLWKAGLDVFLAYPWLGVGPEGFELEASRRNLVAGPDAFHAHAHNVFINILAETGLFGGVAFLMLIGSIVWLLVQTWRRGDKLIRGLWYATLGCLITLFIGGLTHQIIRAEIAILFLLSPALLHAALALRHTEET